MRTQDPGHHFWLNNYAGNKKDWPWWGEQDIQFNKRIGVGYPGNTGESKDGTNCQEVYRALISRLLYLDNQIPCVETKSAIYYTRRALFALEVRAARIKKARLPENVSLDYIETFPICRHCGHIYLHDFDNCRK